MKLNSTIEHEMTFMKYQGCGWMEQASHRKAPLTNYPYIPLAKYAIFFISDVNPTQQYEES